MQSVSMDVSKVLRPLLKWGLALVAVLVLAACKGGDGGGGVSTHTPSPSPSATCDPGSSLSTPEGWKSQSNLVVLVYDPTSMRNENLVLEAIDGKLTNNVEEFAYYLANKLFHDGMASQISVFELGWRSYEEARRVRISTTIERPELYDTPSPLATVTPYPTVDHGPSQGLDVIRATNEAKQQATEQAQAAELIRQLDGCAQIAWDTLARHTATVWAVTQEVERLRATQTLQPPVVSTRSGVEMQATPTPYSRQSVYHGLWHANIDFNADCKKYDRCILLILDDLRTWATDNPNGHPFNFEGVEIYALMPDCRDINQPSCVELQEYWTQELLRYGALSVNYFNGERAEFKLNEMLRR